jgi:putative ABC transport system permease protein
MKFLGLLINNLLRSGRRTLLTVTSITVSLFLIATLRTIVTELTSPPETPDSALRLVTRHGVSLFNALPIAYRSKIAQVEGVEAVVSSMWFGGVYKEPKNFFAQFSVDTDQFFKVYADARTPGDQRQAFLQDRAGALVGENLAQRFGWKLGDRIHLEGALFDFDPELTIRALYAGGADDGSTLYFHREYFEEGLKQAGFAETAFTGTYSIRARSAEEVPRIAERVDALFRNTTSPTKTESEKAFVLGFLAMMGNVQFLITSITSVVIFTIILVAANTMAMSIRERVREIGIMKALGFRKLQILLLLLGESVALALGGALLGSLGAKLLFARARLGAVTGGFFQHLNVTPETIALCAGIGIFVGLVSAGIPAWQAARRRVVDALRAVN